MDPAGKEGVLMVAVTRKFPREPHGEDMASLESIISVRGINKVYPGQVHALKDVDLDFPAGALTTLLGPSGCGKTTLLKIIAGLLAPTTGDVLVKGKKVTAPGPERAFVFQDFALMPWATVLRNVGFGLELRGVAEAKRNETARRYIEQVGLGGFEDKYPHELSGGMRQRVGLARALAADTDVLLMDEAFSALDPLIRDDMQDQLLSLQTTLHKTIIFITHDLDEALKLGDHIAILRDGRLVQVGTPDEILSTPADDYVRKFVEKRGHAAALPARVG
jgi:ABC-type proline/glycine betaine transport system ATPase subunit